VTVGSRIDSNTTGDPALHLGMPALEAGLAALPAAPRTAGRVRLMVGRGEGGTRALPERVRLTQEGGFAGDAWAAEPDRNPEAQITVMEHPVAELIANGQSLALFGDQLFVDLDLARANLPAGTRLRAGSAVLVVTPKPHNGCRKFRARFGADALSFVARADLRHRNFRGIYVRVVEDGDVGVGDVIAVLRTP
jgi:MOSC domain-containing protein YiiM